MCPFIFMIRYAALSTKHMTPQGVVGALHRLRRVVLHYDALNIANQVHSAPKWFDRVLEGSCKLRHVYNEILKIGSSTKGSADKVDGDDDMEIDDTENRSTENNVDDGSKEDADNASIKVIVLASLPESLTLLHHLLLQSNILHTYIHGLQSNINGISDSTSKGTARVDDKNKQAVTHAEAIHYTQAQLQLSAFFNSEDTAGDILLTSPYVLDPMHGGVSLGSGFEFFEEEGGAVLRVVSMDEDWSGRGDLVYRWLGSCGDEVECIKLVSKETCEGSFVLGSALDVNVGGGDHAEEDLSRRTDNNEGTVGTVNSYCSRIIRYAGHKLETVLQCQPLAKDMNTNAAPIFLPQYLPVSDDTNMNAGKSSAADKNTRALHMHMCQAEHTPLNLPPLAPLFPPNVTSRMDVHSLPLRLLCNFYGTAWSQLQGDLNSSISEFGGGGDLGLRLLFYHAHNNGYMSHVPAGALFSEPVAYNGLDTMQSPRSLHVQGTSVNREGIKLDSLLMLSVTSGASTSKTSNSYNSCFVDIGLSSSSLAHEVAKGEVLRQQSDLVYRAVLRRIDAMRDGMYCLCGLGFACFPLLRVDT